MATPPEGEAGAVWRAWLRRLRQRFQDAAKSYLSDHDGDTLGLALIHCDQRFESLRASQENCVARDFIGAWNTYRLGRRHRKRKGIVPTEDCNVLGHYWSAKYSKQPLIWRSLLSNEPLLDEIAMERGNEPSDEEFFERCRQLGERRRLFRTGFDALVGDASRCLKNLPFDWNGRIAKEAVKSGDNQRWLYCLFDVAWNSPGGLLNSERQFYFELGNVSVPYESGAYDHLREWVRRHGGEAEGRTGNIIPSSLPVEWKGRLPECYFSILRDFYGQSVAFVDWLLTVEKATRDARLAATGNRSKRHTETPAVSELHKRVASLEREQTKPTKRLTPKQENRKHRIKFCCPLRRKTPKVSWPKIYSDYIEKYPQDKTASPDSLLQYHDRKCTKCSKDKE